MDIVIENGPLLLRLKKCTQVLFRKLHTIKVFLKQIETMMTYALTTTNEIVVLSSNLFSHCFLNFSFCKETSVDSQTLGSL